MPISTLVVKKDLFQQLFIALYEQVFIFYSSEKICVAFTARFQPL